MFASIPSIDPILQCLLPAFTQPSFQTHVEVFLGWVMCLGRRTEYGVFQTIRADTPISRKQRHPFDRFYNFFSRSAWTVRGLAHEVAVAIVMRLNPKGLLYLVVDDTLLHKRGKHVHGLGWFRDAVASTAKRVATASGNHWVVMGLAIRPMSRFGYTSDGRQAVRRSPSLVRSKSIIVTQRSQETWYSGRVPTRLS